MLKLIFSLLIIGCVFCCTTTQSISNITNVRLQLNRRGFDYASLICQSQLAHFLPTIVFPEISHRINDGPGHGAVTISSLRIDASALQPPTITFQLNPPSNGLTIDVNGGLILMRGRISVWYKWLGTKVTFVGSISATIERIMVHMKLSIVSSNKQTMFRVDECHGDIGAFNLQISSRYGWITDLFRSKVASRMRQSIRDSLCSSGKKMFVDTINKRLQTHHIYVRNKLYIDYAVDSLSIPTVDYMQLDANVMLSMNRISSQDCSIPQSPIDFHNTSTETNMINIWLSDRIIGCLFESIHTSHAFSLLIDYRHLADTSLLRQLLRTTCSFVPCIGKFIPKLGQMYPNRTIDIAVNTAQSPTIHVDPNMTLINVALVVDLYLSPFNATTSSPVISLSLRFNSTIDIGIVDRRLKGTLLIGGIEVKSLKSTVGELSDDLCRAIATILKSKLQKFVSEQLDRGVRLPAIHGVTLKTTNVTRTWRTIRTDSDLLLLMHL